jgi:hypothetical protein
MNSAFYRSKPTMTLEQYILDQRVYCEQCTGLRVATEVGKDGRGQHIAACLEHARKLEPWNHQENQYVGNL